MDCVLDRGRASDPTIKTKVNLNVPIHTVGDSEAGRRLSLARISSRLPPVRWTPAEPHCGANHPLQSPPTANLSPPCLAPDRRWHQEQPLHRSFILAHICQRCGHALHVMSTLYARCLSSPTTPTHHVLIPQRAVLLLSSSAHLSLCQCQCLVPPDPELWFFNLLKYKYFIQVRAPLTMHASILLSMPPSLLSVVCG